MKKIIYFLLISILVFSLLPIHAFAAEYTEFNIVFEEKAGEKVNATTITVFAAVDGSELTDRTADFTMEDVAWFKYITEPEDGKTADDYDYVDEELKIYGMLCGDEDVFEPENYQYFLRIARLYAQEEDSFDRNVKINGVDIEEMNGSCYNTGSEFYIKTVTNGQGGGNAEEEEPVETVTEDEPQPETPSETKVEKPEKKKCKVCGICPVQPLGICLFIWIAIALILIIVLIIVIKKTVGKKNDKQE